MSGSAFCPVCGGSTGAYCVCFPAALRTPSAAGAGDAEALLMAFLDGAGIQVNVCGRDGKALSVESVREIGKFYAKLNAKAISGGGK